jgi:hypothetical protein
MSRFVYEHRENMPYHWKKNGGKPTTTQPARTPFNTNRKIDPKDTCFPLIAACGPLPSKVLGKANHVTAFSAKSLCIVWVGQVHVQLYDVHRVV